MGTLLQMPHLNGTQSAEHSRCQKILASRFAFWRAQEIQQVTDLLQREFPAADVRNAINFGRVVLNPTEGREALTEYVRGILHANGRKLAA